MARQMLRTNPSATGKRNFKLTLDESKAKYVAGALEQKRPLNCHAPL
jgi:hypothetical protein